MSDRRWMIYGGYGYSGRLIAAEAKRKGHAPLLAGRNADKLAASAAELELDHVVVDLNDRAALERALADVDLVVHAAGPFIHTARAVMDACLATKTHYADITGEIPVFQQAFRRSDRAREAGIAMMSGVGFDVVPTDCLARYVADQVDGATELEIAFDAGGGFSTGTAKSIVEGLPSGGAVRRDGKLQRWTIPHGAREQQFYERKRTVVPIPWGDLVTAWHTTGIPNITTFMAQSPRSIRRVRTWAPFLRTVLKVGGVRRFVQRQIDKRVKNPTAAQREKTQSHFWACARGPGGEAQAWMKSVEGYNLTAITSVICAERILAENPTGALTPAGAFGADLILAADGTERFDQLPA